MHHRPLQVSPFFQSCRQQKEGMQFPWQYLTPVWLFLWLLLSDVLTMVVWESHLWNKKGPLLIPINHDPNMAQYGFYQTFGIPKMMIYIFKIME
jgi:hypothetical protein